MRYRICLITLIIVLFAIVGCMKKTSSEESKEEMSNIELPSIPQNENTEKEGNIKEVGKESNKKSDLYDPSIYVIEASSTWTQELTPGYNVHYECELYVDKVDSNDNRSASGLYNGVFWMKVSLDAEEYILDFLKDVPVEMDFNAGGEGVCDNLTMHLLDGYERDPFKDFSIQSEQGDTITPLKDTLAGSGSFIVVASEAYLDIRAEGASGENLDYHNNTLTNEDINYVIHVEPDPSSSSLERKVKIHLSNVDGMSTTLDGTWTRLSGYPEDILKYADSNKQSEILDKHLQ